MQIGLIPLTVNHYVWQETAMGVQLKGDAGPVGYTIGWARGHENQFDNSSSNAFDDADGIPASRRPQAGRRRQGRPLRPLAAPGCLRWHGLLLRSAFEIKGFGNDQYNIYTIGTDGSFKVPVGLFVNWDAIYQGGKIKEPLGSAMSAPTSSMPMSA